MRISEMYSVACFVIENNISFLNLIMLLPRYIIPFEFDLCFIAGQLLHLIDRKDRETPRRFTTRRAFSILSYRVYHTKNTTMNAT